MINNCEELFLVEYIINDNILCNYLYYFLLEEIIKLKCEIIYDMLIFIFDWLVVLYLTILKYSANETYFLVIIDFEILIK